MLEDGAYDAMVVDAEAVAGGGLRLELAVLAGPHKGELVAVRTPAGAGHPLDLLAVPATLTVSDGEPHVRLEASPQRRGAED